jgi:prevent-host-death family protein
MTRETTASDLREHLAEYLDRVEGDAEVLVIHRRDHADLAIVDYAELRSLQETVHVFGGPLSNLRRLVDALEQAERGEGQPVDLPALRAWIERGSVPESVS